MNKSLNRICIYSQILYFKQAERYRSQSSTSTDCCIDIYSSPALFINHFTLCVRCDFVNDSISKSNRNANEEAKSEMAVQGIDTYSAWSSLATTTNPHDLQSLTLASLLPLVCPAVATCLPSPACHTTECHCSSESCRAHTTLHRL